MSGFAYVMISGRKLRLRASARIDPSKREDKNMRKRSGISILLLFFAVGAATAAAVIFPSHPRQTAFDPARIIPVEQMQEDFRILRAALEEGHAGLYRYSGKNEMDRRFDETAAALTKPMTERAFVKLLIPLIASINCGHTHLTASSEFESYLKRRPITPPFKLHVINGKAHLIQNYSDRKLPLGAEVIAINGRSVSDIIAALLPAIPSDGRIESAKYQRLSDTIYFGRLYNIFYGDTPVYEIDFWDEEAGTLATEKTTGLSFSQINRRARERYPESNRSLPPASFEYRDGVPVLTIRTFGSGVYRAAGIDYPAFLKKTFRELDEKKAPNLIIDLRNNGGGSDDFGRILFSYFIDEPFRYYAALETKKLTYDFLKYTDVPESQRTRPEQDFSKNERGWYDVLAHPNVGVMKPIGPTFRGKTYVLINGRSFSASGEATSPMHFHRKAVFIGEECGAGYYGNNSGFMPGLTLPHSGVRVRIPLVRYTMAVEGYPADRGIIPEHRVDPTVADILSGRDTVMAYALDLAEKENENAGKPER